MSEPMITQEAVEEALRSAQSRRRNRLIKRFGRDDLLYLVLVPAWTQQLAEECKFPVSKPLEQFLDEALAAGICQKSESSSFEQSEWYSAYIYTSLAPYLPAQHLYEALKYVLGIEDILLRAQSLAKLLPFLPTDLFQYALQSVQGILSKLESPRDRVTIQLMLIPHVPEGERLSIVQEALEVIRKIPYTDEQVRALKSLVPYIPSSSRFALLEIINTIAEHRECAEGLIALVPLFDGDQRLSLLETAEHLIATIRDENVRTWLSSLLAEGYARSRDLKAVMLITSNIGREVAIATMTRIIRNLAPITMPLVEDDFTERAIEFARGLAMDVRNDIKSVNLICELAQASLQLGKRTIAHDFALRIYAVVSDVKAGIQKFQLSQILCALAQLWGPEESGKALEVMGQAYDTASSIDDALERCRALTMLAKIYKELFGEYVSGQTTMRMYVQEALAAARFLRDPKERIQELVALAPLVPSDDALQVLQETLSLAQGMNKTLSFWMPDPTRNEMLEDIKGLQGTSFLLQRTQKIGEQISIAQQRSVSLSPMAARWAEMAKAGPEGAAELLTSEVKGLLEKGDTVQATSWVSAASLLCEVFKGSLEMAVLLGKRRIELAYRQMQDKRYLQSVLVRPEQVDAFRALVRNAEEWSRDTLWALHYIGMGGVGKTTLIRYITSVLAPQMMMPTCRVDFDYLNPDYPVRKPGQLLIELAQELQFYGAIERHEHLFREFQKRVVSYHEKLSQEPFSVDPLANIKRPEFDKVLRTFCDFISRLPQPVLFILDTCEELTRLQSAAGWLPNVEATFEVLERIHDRVPSIRVIFAGRRLLARSGDGWFLDTSRMREGQALLPAYKSYLQLHEIRGFPERETHDFLTTVKKLSISGEMEGAIRKRSPEAGRTAPVELIRSDRQTEVARYNPFYLSLYADWVQEMPALTPADIERGTTDPFVEMRIIGRIKRDDVSGLLPALLLLRRFDRTLLRAVYRGNPATFDEFFWELGNLEWLEYQLEEKNVFLEVKRPLYERLLEYYEAEEERQAQLEAASKQLVPVLTALIEGLALGDLRLNHIEAALRILPQEQSAQLWERLSRRITEEEAWDWVRPISAYLLGEDGVVAKREHKAHALVLATHISVAIHEQFDIDLGPFWDEVRKTVTERTTQQTVHWLQKRALAGRVAAIRLTKPPFSQSLLNAFWSLVNQFSDSLKPSLESDPFRAEQLAGSLCAAIETLLEEAEMLDQAELLPDPVRVVNWSRSVRNYAMSPVLQAFSVMLAARTMALHKRWEEANGLFQRACALLPDAAEYQSWQRQRWEDWRLPSSVTDYIRLQFLHVMPRHLLAIDRDSLLRWQVDASSRLHCIDAERLVSAILTRRLAHEIIPATELEKLTEQRTVSDYRPDCNAYRLTLPLFATCVLALEAMGRVEDALHNLDTLFEASTIAADNTGSINRVATHTRLRIIRRMRLADTGSSYRLEQAIRSSDPEDLALALPAFALTAGHGHTPSAESLGLEYDERLANRHAWWRSQVAWTKDIVTPSVIRLLRGESGRDEDDVRSEFARVSLEMDYYEAALLSEHNSLPGPDAVNGFPGLEEWMERYPTQAEQSVRLMLRSYALDIAVEEDPEEVIERWATRLGMRWMADLALDEGELLVLRLPERACKLLDLAARWFAAVDDSVGACIAALCSCIATIHTGETTELAAALRRVQDAYNVLVERKELALLSWTGLTEMLLSPYPWYATIALEKNKIADSWIYWLERIIFCVLYEQALRTNRLDKFPKELVGELGKSDVASLAIELTPPSPDAKRRREALTTEADSRQPPKKLSILDGISEELLQISPHAIVKNASRVYSALVTMAVNLLVLIGVGYGGYVLFDGLVSASKAPSVYADLGPGWKIAIYVLLLVCLIGIGWLMRRPMIRLLRSILASIVARSYIRLHIFPAEKYSAPVSLEASVEVHLRLQWRAIDSKLVLWELRLIDEMLEVLPVPGLSLLRAVLPFSDRLSADIATDAMTPTLQPYPNAAEKVPDDIRQLLTRLQTYLGKHQLAVPLVVAPGLEGICWEGLYNLVPGLQREQEWNETFQCWRTGDPLPADRTSAVIVRTSSYCIGVLAHPTWDPIISEGWRPWMEQVRGTQEQIWWVRHTTLNALHDQKNQAVIHVIGNPIVAASGLRLRISAPYRFDPSTSVEETIRGEGMNLLLRGEDLLLSSVRLVILQAEPIEIERRLDTDREEAYDLRSFAAGIFAAGATAVIVLPPLSPSLAKAVLNELATALREQPAPSRTLILRMISRVRHIIATWTPSGDQEQPVDADTLQELALDVCMFARWKKNERSQMKERN